MNMSVFLLPLLRVSRAEPELQVIHQSQDLQIFSWTHPMGSVEESEREYPIK